MGRNYYFVSYYARLAKGGFGFGTDYLDFPDTFDLLEANKMLEEKTGLKKNDISIISRILVPAKEAINYQRDIEAIESSNKQLQPLFTDER